MIQQWLIKIDEIYLTHNQESSGTRYLSEVDVNQLDYEFLKNERVDMRGNLYNEMTEVGQKSKVITINLKGLTFAHYVDLRDILREFDSTGEPVQVVGSHPYENDLDFDLSCSFRSMKRKGLLTTTERDVELVFVSFDVTEES